MKKTEKCSKKFTKAEKLKIIKEAQSKGVKVTLDTVKKKYPELRNKKW